MLMRNLSIYNSPIGIIDNIEPLASTVDQELIKREDQVKIMNEKKDILLNSPEDNEDFYVVPKVIE